MMMMAEFKSKATTTTTTSSAMALAQQKSATHLPLNASNNKSKNNKSSSNNNSNHSNKNKSSSNNNNSNNNNNNSVGSNKKVSWSENVKMTTAQQTTKTEMKQQKLQQQQQQRHELAAATLNMKIKSENSPKVAKTTITTTATATGANKFVATSESMSPAIFENGIKKEILSSGNGNASTITTTTTASTTTTSTLSSSDSSCSSSLWSLSMPSEDAASSSAGDDADEDASSSSSSSQASSSLQSLQQTSSSSSQSSQSIFATTPRPVLLTAVNPHIICHLCQGYLINATTIVECLHSFCHSCLIDHLRRERYCPRCEMVINNAKPNIKSDTTLQAIVYKLVPGLYERELMRKRAFYKDRPEEAALATPEQRGDDTEHLIFSPKDDMSLSLEYADLSESSDYKETLRPRYLQCPAMCRVSHLKKFVYDKFEIDPHRFSIDIMYKVKTIVLLDYYTLMDIAYIYTWKRDAPMRFYFRVNASSMSPPPPPLPKPPSMRRPIASEAAASAVTTVTSVDSGTLAPVKVEKSEVIPSIPLSPPSPSTPTPPTTTTVPNLRIKLEKVEDTKVQQQLPNNNNSKSSTNNNNNNIKPNDHCTVSPTSEPLKIVINREKQEPNIKLKIDLSKQNSVTIINMTDPERREVVKLLKPDKESRSKSKKDKEHHSPKGSPGGAGTATATLASNERKRKSPSPLTVPPLTIRTERITSPNGVSTFSPRVMNSSNSNNNNTSANGNINSASAVPEEDPKSEFLKSFALTPIKVKKESPEKPSMPSTIPNVIPYKKPSPPSLAAAKPKLMVDDSMLMKPPTAMPPKSIASSKRKSKEPVKAVSKKPKLSPPLPREDFKIRLPSVVSPSPPPTTTTTTTATSKGGFGSSSDKPLMPPPSKVPAAPAAPRKQQPPALQYPPLPPSPMPHSMGGGLHQGVQMAAPGNRTPIAKRYQPILPKASRPNPFANIPSIPNDVNRLLKDAGTEIKSIASKSHIYGPKQSQQPHSKDTTTKMGPPPTPPPPQSSSLNHQKSTPSPSQSPRPMNGHGNNSNHHKTNNYLNLALFNAGKSKGKEAPPGCRTPMYTPNSPIYSPSSPQYVPNYSTYKYTPPPKPSPNSSTNSNGGNNNSSSNNYLQNVLGGGSNSLAGLFPSPPTKTIDQNTKPGNSGGGGGESLAPPRTPVYPPFARSPSPCEEAPEKQQVKVKSLLNSCNISIPSSLSITISRDNGDASSPSSGIHPKHKSPVNNYIEIVKLPDQPQLQLQSQSQSQAQAQLQPPVQAMEKASSMVTHTTATSVTSSSKIIPSPQHLMARMSMPPSPINGLKSEASSKSVVQSDKKTPSPEKRNAATAAQQHSTSPSSSANNSHHNSENKLPKMGASTSTISGGSAGIGGNDPAAKKFRPILPRQNASPLPTNGTTTTNDGPSAKLPSNGLMPIGTYAAPSGVAVKVHASAKKVAPSKKSPPTQISPPKTSPKANAIKAAAAAKTATPPPPTPSMTMPSLPTISASGKMMTTPMGIASSAAASAAAANTAALDLFKENLLRAQVAQVAQAAQAAQAAQVAQAAQSNLLYNFAQMNPALYNYQQAYFMEQLSRMQRAGNEVFNDYLQKLKVDEPPRAGMPMLPTVTLPSAITGGGGAVTAPPTATAAASPKTSPSMATAKLTPATMAKGNASPRQQATTTITTNATANNKNTYTSASTTTAATTTTTSTIIPPTTTTAAAAAAVTTTNTTTPQTTTTTAAVAAAAATQSTKSK